MTALRRTLLTLLPKVLISRLTGLATRIPLPRAIREPAFRRFAERYGIELDQVPDALSSYRSFAAFFQRAVRDGARPIAETQLVWPNDGKIVTSGRIEAGRIPQVKGQEYGTDELVGDKDLGAALSAGHQTTIYLAPGDYHRVHSPFAGEITKIWTISGTLFPVNQPAVRAIPRLFVRNARVVFEYRLSNGQRAAVVMVGALNVGDMPVSIKAPCAVQKGDEIGRFGFGSTTVSLIDDAGPSFLAIDPETYVRMGQAASVS